MPRSASRTPPRAALLFCVALAVAACGRRAAEPTPPPAESTLLRTLRLAGERELRAFRIGEESREAVAPALGTERVLPVGRVETGRRLAFAYGVSSGEWVHRNTALYAFAVRWRGADGTTRALYKQTTRSDAYWFDVDIPLGDLAGTSGEIVFTIDGAGPSPPGTDPSPGVPVWGEAALLSTVEPPADRRPSFLWVTIDTVRADHLGAYGYERDTSPFFDSLAGRGVFFTSAYAHAPWTRPSTKTMMRSRYYDETEWDAEDDLPAVFRAHGYDTIAWIGNSAAAAYDIGFTRFFEVWDETIPGRFKEWLRTAGPKPFFAYVHLLGAHIPYNFHPGASEAFIEPDDAEAMENMFRPDLAEKPSDADIDRLIRLYDGEIRRSDRIVKALVEALEARGLGDDTYIVVTSDHGDEFWEHGGYQHGHSFYDELLHVPLVIVPPASRTGRTITATTGLIRVAPTLLAAAGVPVPDSYLGLPLDLTGGDQADDPVYFADLVFPDLYYQVLDAAAQPGAAPLERDPQAHGVRFPGMKAVRNRRGDILQLFDLRADPGERVNLASDPVARAEAEALMNGFRESLSARNYSCGLLRMRFTSPVATAWTVEFASDLKVLPAQFGTDMERLTWKVDPGADRTTFELRSDADAPYSLSVRLLCGARRLSARFFADGTPLETDRIRWKKPLGGMPAAGILANLAAEGAQAAIRTPDDPEKPPARDLGVEIWLSDDTVPRLNAIVPNHDEELKKALRSLGYLQ